MTDKLQAHQYSSPQEFYDVRFHTLLHPLLLAATVKLDMSIDDN